jgi:hypothetical protein
MVSKRRAIWIAAGAVVFGTWLVLQIVLRDPWPAHDGRIRQTAELRANGLRRGVPGQVVLMPIANYTIDGELRTMTVPESEIDGLRLSLVDAAGAVTPLKTKWNDVYGTVTLPEVPDGNYKLRGSYTTSLGTGELDLDLPLFTPARVHVITDRPLYEPGNLVRFRAVVLNARDLGPLDGRPGTWIVKDPDGEILLEEKAPAGDWGVVAGTFPLDSQASVGSWRVAWVSHDATDEVSFAVEPFTLPRFRVAATPTRPFYRPGDKPSIKGAVTYSSGAPVANARLDIAWDVLGEWPPPAEWQATLLPKQAVTGANGSFDLAVPTIPIDLQGQATLIARIAAIDPAGDRATGSAAVLLSQDGIGATAVTELGDGLVQGFNNRMYVRVTTPDGRVVSNTKVKVTRAWQIDDPGIDADLDEDGVASLQIDPGPANNIVIPARPWRPAPKRDLVSRGEALELIGDTGAPLPDQVEMDRWPAALAPCAKWVSEDGGSEVRVGLRVAASGAIVLAGSGSSQLQQCAVAILRTRKLPSGSERMYSVDFTFEPPDLPNLSATVETTIEVPDGLHEAMSDLARSTRDCLPLAGPAGELPRAIAWRARAGEKDVEIGGWIDDPSGGDATTSMACVASRIGTRRIRLDEPAASDTFGLVRFEVDIPDSIEAQRPQATTMLGYELRVSVPELDGKPSTVLRVRPGDVPDLRLRVTPILAAPGETITAELIRGPDFGNRKLPDELVMTWVNEARRPDERGESRHEAERRNNKRSAKSKLDAERKTTFTIEAAAEGWHEITGGGARALVYVKPAAELAVTIKPARDRYAPGDNAALIVQTLLGGKGGQAAVGLFGVDDSLSQLVPLPGAGDMARVRPKVETGSPAFGLLDGQALSLGRIRGANAAAATVLRVTTIPPPAAIDAQVFAETRSQFDPIEELTDRFFVVLAELHVQTRAWEASAPAAEKMQPKTMAMLWKKALAACEKRGERVDDAFGRRLRLSALPADLLSMTDPRAVVVVGTRLPEDVDNWAVWVEKEMP